MVNLSQEELTLTPMVLAAEAEVLTSVKTLNQHTADMAALGNLVPDTLTEAMVVTLLITMGAMLQARMAKAFQIKRGDQEAAQDLEAVIHILFTSSAAF